MTTTKESKKEIIRENLKNDILASLRAIRILLCQSATTPFTNTMIESCAETFQRFVYRELRLSRVIDIAMSLELPVKIECSYFTARIDQHKSASH